METIALPDTIRQTVIHPAPEHWASGGSENIDRTRQRNVVFVGPLVWPGKAAGVSLLLEAFAKVAPNHPDWRLKIYGDGPLREGLEKEATQLDIDRVVDFLGSVESGLDGLNQASIYAQVSLQEGLPLSLLNAMAMGIPVIATSVGGMPEVLQDSVTGILVQPTVGRLAVALEFLMQDQVLREQLGFRARQWVSDTLSWNDVARRGLELVKGSHT